MSFDTLVDAFNGAVFWFGTLVAAASVVVKATPTQKDDAVLGKIIKILDCVSVVNAKIQKTDDAVKHDDKR